MSLFIYTLFDFWFSFNWQSAEKVIIFEYMDGVRLNDFNSLQDLGVDKKKLVEEITRAYAHQIYVDGFFNGDPHPGTYGVSLAVLIIIDLHCS